MASFNQGFELFRANKLFADVVILGKNKKAYHAHKIIIAYSSGRLARRMSDNKYAEEKIENLNVLDVSSLLGDTSEANFELVLAYMYRGEIKSITLKNLVELFVISENLKISTLLTQLEQYLAGVAKESVREVLPDAIRLGCKTIVKHLITVIAQNFSDFVENAEFDWSSLPFSAINPLLHHPALLPATEAHVFIAISRFLKKYNPGDLTEDQLISLFESVRFERLDYATLERALNHPLVPKSLLSQALMIKLAKFEKPDGAADERPLSPAGRGRRRASYGRLFQYSGVDFDTKGVLYYIGTQEYRAPWQNPMVAKLGVVVTFSSIEKGQPHFILDRDNPKECWTQDVPSSWIQIDLGDGRALKPSCYTLRHGSQTKQDQIRNWVLKGSNDGINFDNVLQRHKDDESLNRGNFASCTWKISPSQMAYRIFRIVQTGHNSSKSNFLSISGIELFGGTHGAFITLN